MRSAGVVSVAVFMSRVTGLLREVVMARLFGAGLIYDAFMLGFRIPNLTRDLFAEGALSSAFVPTFTEYLSQRSKEEAARLVNLVATALIIVVGAVCAAGHDLRARAGAPAGARATRRFPANSSWPSRMTRIMFPFLLLVALAAQAMGVLNACNQFGVPALASTFFNIGSVGFGIVLGIVAGAAAAPHAHRRHGDRRGARRRAATDLAIAQPAPPGLPLPRDARLVRSRAAAHPAADGSGDPGQRRRADQRDGEHQFRLHHFRSGTRLGRPGELAELCVPLHAASPGPVRRGDGVGDAALHLAQRGAPATWTNSAERCRIRWAWCFC